MRNIITVLLPVYILLICAGNTTSQELPYPSNSKIDHIGTNAGNPYDYSSIPPYRIQSSQEIALEHQMRNLKQTSSGEQMNLVQKQLDQITGTSVTMESSYIGGGTAAAEEYDILNNSLITRTNLISYATATESRGTTIGRIWTAVTVPGPAGSGDSLFLYRSDDGGSSFVLFMFAWLGGTDRFLVDQMDMEIVEPATGEKFVWITYGLRANNGSGAIYSAGVICRTPTFQANLFALTWPGNDPAKDYTRPRITSDNTVWPSGAWLFGVCSFDSVINLTNRFYGAKYFQVNNPYTTTPVFTFFGPPAAWFLAPNSTIDMELYSDIAFFQRGGVDSMIMSQNFTSTAVTDTLVSRRLYFSKRQTTPGAFNTSGLGFITGSNYDRKENARISSNGNDNGVIYSIFRQFTSGEWAVKYFRTTNYGNFAAITGESSLLGNSGTGSSRPDIMGWRFSDKHSFIYGAYGTGTGDIAEYSIVTTNGFTGGLATQRMNHTTLGISTSRAPSAGRRYVNNDSCFAIFADFGPQRLWTAAGCSGAVTGITDPVMPVSYALEQNYPNPFNPTTSIRYSIPVKGIVKLVVFDITGKEVSTLVNEFKEAGNYIVDFNAASLSSGAYFYKISSGEFTQMKKMLLLK